MKLLVILLCFCSSPLPLLASLTDPYSVRDSIARVDSLNELAFRVKRTDINKALILLYKAGALAEKCSYKKGIATSIIYEAGIYQQHGHSKKALSLYYKALELADKNDDQLNVAKARQQIGNAMFEEKKLGEAEQLYKQSLVTFRQMQLLEDVINITNALGVVYMAQHNSDLAARYFNQALQASRKANYVYGEKKADYSLGLLYTAQNNLQQARKYFLSALQLNKQSNDRYGLALNKNKLAKLAASEGRFRESKQWALGAYNDALSISALSLVVEALESIINVYKKEADNVKVIGWQNILIREQKALFEKEKAYASNFLDIIKQVQTEQIEAQKEALTAQQNAKYSWIILTILAAAFIVLACLIFQLYKNYSKVKGFSRELSEKNKLISENLQALNLLNEAILKQNSSLEESNQMKDKLLSILSHDLRQPLSSTRSILELLNDDILTVEDSKQLFVDLQAQYVRVMTLLDNLLFWIKGQMKGSEISFEEINIKKLVAGVIEELNIALLRKNISVNESITDGITISGHTEMLKVVFRNLLSNAIKYTDGGAIYVYCSNCDGLGIHIKDNGLGMSPANLLKVKSRTYFTTNGTNKEQGSGFGLMICKDLIQNHEGELLIESEPGKGSIFTVRFPPHRLVHIPEDIQTGTER